MTAEIHPAYEILKMQAAHYDHRTKIILEHTAENDALIAQLELVKNIQSVLNADMDNDKAVDYTSNASLRKWVEELRKIDSNLMAEPGKWSQGQRKHYSEMLSGHVSMVTRKINSEFVEQRQEMEVRNHIDKIAADMVKLYQEQDRASVRNQPGRG